MSLTIVDEAMTEESSISFKQEVTTSEAYLSLNAKVEEKTTEIQKLMDQVTQYRTDIEKAINEKNAIQATVELLQNDIKQSQTKLELTKSATVNFEARVNNASAKIEMDGRAMTTASSKVTTFKGEFETKTGEFEALFQEIEEYLCQ